MYRNANSHFDVMPAVDVKRSTFDLSHGSNTTLNAGFLIPDEWLEVLPGDTFSCSTGIVCRSQTMLAPIMDNIFIDHFWFFVPNRLIWDHWENFCGQNDDSAWAPKKTYRMPCISAPSGGFKQYSLADYLGLPINTEWSATEELSPSALPFRAYALICDYFFRNQNVTDPLLIPTDDANQTGSNGSDYVTDVANGGVPFKVAKLPDLFTRSLPAPQKGAPVSIPIDIPAVAGGNFPVVSTPTINTGNTSAVLFSKWDALDTPSSDPKLVAQAGNNAVFGSSSVKEGRAINNLQAIIPELSPASSVQVGVNDLRLAFAMQRYLESLARSGSRYQEILLGLYGVHSPDARLQIPEYLGGNRVPVNISEVSNTAQTPEDFLGDLGAKSATGSVHSDFQKSFTEHGMLFSLFCIRYHHSYSQGISKKWTRKTFTDIYNPQFANLGETPVYQAELWTDGKNLKRDKIFGYNEIWAEYRHISNHVSAEMRPNATNTKSMWNLSDNYDAAPTLSDEWMRETPKNLDRCLAVQSTVENQFLLNIWYQMKATRPMPMYSVPGLTEHF